PFAGGSTAEVFAALLRENPPPVSTVNPAMPKKLDPIVAKLLAKDPAQRYSSADRLQEDLEALVANTGKMAATAGANGRKWSGAIAALLLLLIAGGLAWWRYRPTAAPAVLETGAPATPAATTGSIIFGV